MAAHIAQRSYLICGFVGVKVTPQHVKLKSVFMRDINNTVQQSIGYGTRGTDPTQDTQVHIPVERLRVSYSRSSGPGGQHVNKVSTKAEVRFHVLTAEWIPADIRQKIFEKNKNRINKAGELLVTSELSRSQHRNLSDCIQKISDIIAQASEKPYEPTAEDIALREARLEKGNKERLRQKKIHSATKRSRQVDFD
ncbi:peptidyl-tRNA hydrolase ICT1, mitochondrial isoform X1 [Plectropomus leopardus]|uniref:peptidyl-tRNA hydrolase ICT1, mitochondrial isoform X1 n=1 Tax=Plectropomus leopardus TaxID=160734 RepID=UPI001C4BC6F8|nr:peptidyl-tRNA hydrolase ICT1, mitochondrial isoform X1 [Plectropomus leopardus]